MLFTDLMCLSCLFFPLNYLTFLKLWGHAKLGQFSYSKTVVKRLHSDELLRTNTINQLRLKNDLPECSLFRSGLKKLKTTESGSCQGFKRLKVLYPKLVHLSLGSALHFPEL